MLFSLSNKPLLIASLVLLLGLILGFFLGTFYANYRLVAALQRTYGFTAYYSPLDPGPVPSSSNPTATGNPSGDTGPGKVIVGGGTPGGPPAPPLYCPTVVGISINGICKPYCNPLGGLVGENDPDGDGEGFQCNIKCIVPTGKLDKKDGPFCDNSTLREQCESLAWVEFDKCISKDRSLWEWFSGKCEKTWGKTVKTCAKCPGSDCPFKL